MRATFVPSCESDVKIPGLGGIDPPARFKKALLRLWNAYWDYQARRATAVVLYALDDSVLDEMGIDRGEVESMLSAHAGACPAWPPPISCR